MEGVSGKESEMGTNRHRQGGINNNEALIR